MSKLSLLTKVGNIPVWKLVRFIFGLNCVIIISPEIQQQILAVKSNANLSLMAHINYWAQNINVLILFVIALRLLSLVLRRVFFALNKLETFDEYADKIRNENK